jgi:hypothetical protein
VPCLERDYPVPPPHGGQLHGRFCGVILTGAFLAEQVATIDNKLNVAGGVLSKFTVGPDRSASFALVVLTRADADSDNSDRRVEVELIPPTGEAPVRRSFEVPEASIGEFPGFAFFGLDVILPVDGRWVIVVTGGTEAITLPLLVDTWTPPQTQSLGI